MREQLPVLTTLGEFEVSFWGQRYLAITLSWRRNGTTFPESVRRITYTTDEIDKR